MFSRVRLQIIVGLMAAVWFGLALLTGQQMSPAPLRLYSIGGAVVTLAFLAYEHIVWRWQIVRRFTRIPLVAGTWRGILTSSYIRPDGTPVAPVPVALRITQTASTFTATLLTPESSSTSRQERVFRLADGRWCLSWLYDNAPKPSVRDRSDRHYGACEVRLGGQDGEELAGEYFTDRLTRGELQFVEWSPRLYGSAAQALAGTEFLAP